MLTDKFELIPLKTEVAVHAKSNKFLLDHDQRAELKLTSLMGPW